MAHRTRPAMHPIRAALEIAAWGALVVLADFVLTGGLNG